MADQFPEYITSKISENKNYYSLDSMDNIERAKLDSDYLGDVMIVNENLIWHSIHKYCGKPEIIIRNNCLEKDDLLQLGRMGFIKSIKAFDTTRGIKFSSFSVTAIVREIRCFLRDSASIIRPTRTANELINRIKRTEADLGYLPTTSDLSILLGEDEEKINKAIMVGQQVKYLDEPMNSPSKEHEYTLMDSLETSDIESEVIDKVYVDSLLDLAKEKLTDKECTVLLHRIAGYNQTQTAKKENISQMRVSRIMKKVARLLEDETITN